MPAVKSSKVVVPEEMIARSPVRRGKAVKKKTEISNSTAGNISTPKQGGESSATSIGKAIHKLDDQAFKPFGPRSRSSSEAGSDVSFCKGGPNRVCGDTVKNSDDGVQCDKCDGWYHINCQDVPKPAYEALRKYKVLSWFCSECRKVVRKDDSKLLVAIEGKIDEMGKVMNEKLGLMVTCLRENEKSVDEQTKLIERTVRENAAQKSSYADMVKGTCSDVVEKVSAKLSNFPQLALGHTASKDAHSISKVFDDFMDRDRRKCNLVVHNLPESGAETLGDRSAKDIMQFQKLAKDAFRLHVKISRCFRVGKAIPDRHRLLILTLESPELKQDLLQLAPQLRNSPQYENIFITPDLSKAEREIAKKLRDELKARKAAGEVNLIIRKGKIVSSVKQNPPNTDTGPSGQVTPQIEGTTRRMGPAGVIQGGETSSVAEPLKAAVRTVNSTSAHSNGIPTQGQA